MMHCFAWTSIKEATPADWQAFFKASDDMTKNMKMVKRVWYGKLVSPLGQLAVTKADDETRKKLRAGEPQPVEARRLERDWGMCMEMTDEAARKAYAEHPYHKVWTAAYSKIRVDGTTTFDFLGK